VDFREIYETHSFAKEEPIKFWKWSGVFYRYHG